MYKAAVVFVLGAMLALASLLAKQYQEFPKHLIKESFEEKLYQISYGTVLCQYRKVEPCGVTLSLCIDGRTYYCLDNVFFEDNYSN